MTDFDALLNASIEGHYHTLRELRYGREAGAFLSGFEANAFLNFKQRLAQQGDARLVPLPLLAWNDETLYYAKAQELSSLREELYSMIEENAQEFGNFLSLRLADEITKSRIYSEIEGSLNVEEVPTTRKRIIELLDEGSAPETRNDRIIVNMARGIDFVAEKPSFDAENLHRLYTLLSEGCLDEEDRLSDGAFYRDDGVDIDIYHGCPHQRIQECMDSLFRFVNEHLADAQYRYVLPHIAHYYLLYVHPYFDYNGRTARMVSLWVSTLMGATMFPSVISEAIDQTKSRYYASLRETRNSKNDLTYFLIYIYETSLDYFLTYRNLEHIQSSLQRKGILWTNAERAYFKKILVSYDGPFTYRDFERITKTAMSKQGALKILGRLEDLGLLKSQVSAKTKVFSLNEEALRYLPRYFPRVH